jgi:periplasmic protein CpxP/Spy
MEGRQLEMLTQKLNLTADQQTKVKAIDEDTGKQMMAVRNDTSLSQDDKRAKMMDIRKSSQDKIRGVLTDEQKMKYDAMLAEMKERMKERQQGAAPPAPPQ